MTPTNQPLVLRCALAGALLPLLLVSIRTADGAAGTDPAEMPLLPGGGIRLYTQEAYEGFDPQITEAVDARYRELVAAGMDTARYLFDWRDLEPEPGQYDIGLAVEAMEFRRERGIALHFANVVVIDSAGPVVPEFVEDLLAAGLPWDDPRITEPFGRLLEELIPVMLDRGLFMLGLSNEPGGYYEDEPIAAASFRGFIEAAIARAHAVEPQLTCTVVFAGPTDPAIPDLMPLVDAAAFNTYFYVQRVENTCTLEGFPLPLWRAEPASEVGPRPGGVGPFLDDLIAAAGGRLVNIQEIGQATGWNDEPETLGPFAGLEFQEAIYRELRIELDRRSEHIRTVCNWTLNDHTKDGMRYFVEPILDAGFPRCYAANLGEIFGPTGLVRSDAVASKKPAFAEFEAAVRFFAGARRPR